MKKTILGLILLSSLSFALELDELTKPKDIQGLVSTSDKIEEITTIESKVLKTKTTGYTLAPIEIKYENLWEKTYPPAQETQKAQENNEVKVVKQKEKIEEPKDTKVSYSPNYADLSLKKLADDVSFELEMDSDKINSDLSVLWSATTENSETMKYTIYKLSNPDEDKPDESTLKKILKPIANFSSVAGATVAADPYIAAGALIGGGLLNAVMKDDKELNYTFSKVSDTDMILLVRKIDDLQKKLLDLYVDYRTKQQLAKLTKKNYEKREKIYENSQNKSKEELIIADVYYRNAKVDAQRAQDDYITSRAILENLVGLDALKKIEED